MRGPSLLSWLLTLGKLHRLALKTGNKEVLVWVTWNKRIREIHSFSTKLSQAYKYDRNFVESEGKTETRTLSRDHNRKLEINHRKPVKTSKNLWVEEDKMKLTKYLDLNCIYVPIKACKMQLKRSSEAGVKINMLSYQLRRSGE